MTHASSAGATFPPLRNALAILRSFRSGDERLGVVELADRTGLHKSSVSRLLVALEEERLVSRDVESRRYALDLGLVQLAGPFLGSLDLRHAARPVLASLRDDSRESVALVQWSGEEAVVVEQETSPQEIAHNTPVGTRYRTALSSSVQVFLASLGEDDLRTRLTARPAVFDDADDLDVEAYVADLRRGRAQGVFTNIQRSAPDAIGLAAPVFDHRGDLTGAILLAAPAFRVDSETLTVRENQVRSSAERLSSMLGASADQRDSTQSPQVGS